MSEPEQLPHTPRRLLLGMTPPQMASVLPWAHVPLLQHPPLQVCVVELHDVVHSCVDPSQAMYDGQSVADRQPQWKTPPPPTHEGPSALPAQLVVHVLALHHMPLH